MKSVAKHYLVTVLSILTVLILGAGIFWASLYDSKTTEAQAETQEGYRVTPYGKDIVLTEDPNTHIVYIKNKVSQYNHVVLTPYYSENGKLCRFVSGKIVEIGD